MLTLDPTTYAEYTALTAAADRAQAVLAALANPVTVRVYDGAGQVMGQGTISAPWATRSGALLTVNPMQAFTVLVSGSPDPATWYLRFESGGRSLRGTFGLTGSGADFTWSKPTWVAGQSGFVRTVAATAYDAPVAFTWLVPDDYGLGNLQQGQTLDISALYSATEGQALSFVGYDLPTGVTVDEATGAISAAGDATTGAATIEIDGRLASQIFEPAITNEPQGELYATVDDGGADSPTYQMWNARLNVAWRNINTGDWIDVNGVPNGADWFTRTAVPTDNTTYAFDVATLVQRALTSGQNKGFYLKTSGTSASVPMDGRLGTIPPTLQVITDQGTFNCACLATAVWTWPLAGSGPSNGTTTFRIASNRVAIVRFDLSGVTGTVQSATMSLRVNDRSGTSVYVNVFEADPPAFQIGAGALEPVLGLAAEVGENNLAAADGTPLHPDVLAAGHFGGTQFLSDSYGAYAVAPRISGFNRISYNNTAAVVADPDAPGTSYWRAECVNVVPGGANRTVLIARKQFMLPDYNDPLFPVDMATHVDEIWARCYFMYETDFLDATEGIKMGLSLDTRLGYWVSDPSRDNGGYWQSHGGSSDSYGDGMMHRGDCHDAGASANPAYVPYHNPTYYYHNDLAQSVYKGNMCWNQGGYTGTPGQPNWDVRPMRRYDYSIDMPNSPYADGQSSLSNVVEAKVRLGRWYCLERHMKLNTLNLSQPIYGLKDGSFYDNYEANADGIMETWLNGVLIDRRTDYRWRRHAHIGIRAAGMEWYVGGNDSTNWPAPMHFRVSHVVLARRYIGPRVRP